MANTRAIKAGSAFIELFLRDTVSRGLVSVQRQLESFGRRVTGIGGAFLGLSGLITAPLVAMSSEFAQAGDAIEEAAARTGIATAQLTQLNFAAELAGVSAEGLERAIFRMNRQIDDLRQGSQQSSRAFAALGLSMDDLIGLTPDEQFKRIADQIARIEDPSKKAAVAFDIFGKSGQQLIPLLDQGSEGIAEMQRRAAELGITIGTDGARAASVMADSWDFLLASVRGVRLQIGEALAPDLTRLMQLITRIVSGTSKWIAENRNIVRSVAAAGVAIGVIGGALVVVGTGFIALGAVIGGVATTIGAIGSVLSTIGGALAALLSPIGLVIAAVGAAGVAFVRMADFGRGSLGFIAEGFRNLFSIARETIGGIADALAAGDISLAAQVLWAGLQLEWRAGISALNSQWAEWKAFFLNIITEAKINAAILFTDIWAGMQAGWFESLDLMKDGWTVFTDSLKNIWTKTQGFIYGGRNIAEEVIAKRDAQRDTTILEREQQRQAKLDQLERDRLAARATLEEQRAAEQAEIERNRQASLEASQGDVEAARKRFAESLAAAAAARSQADAAGNGLPQRFAAMVDNLSETATLALEKVQTGTFFGRQAEQIFGEGDRATDLARRTLAVNQQQLEEQRKTRKAVEDNKLAFGQ
jgi:hypothetical protein